MSTFFALARRELGVYFVSPIAYVILTAVLVVSGVVFVGSMENFAGAGVPAEFGPTLMWTCWVVVLTSALVTMRLIAEEKARGTLEIALTAPVSETPFVLAKFAAAVVLMATLILPSVGYVAIIAAYGEVDAGAVAGGYLGILLAGATAYSIGLFVSSLCTSQVTAGMITFAVTVVLLVVSMMTGGLPEGSPWRPFLIHMDLTLNVADFMRGVIDTRRLVYFLTMIVFFLFLTVRAVESRRWR